MGPAVEPARTFRHDPDILMAPAIPPKEQIPSIRCPLGATIVPRVHFIGEQWMGIASIAIRLPDPAAPGARVPLRKIDLSAVRRNGHIESVLSGGKKLADLAAVRACLVEAVLFREDQPFSIGRSRQSSDRQVTQPPRSTRREGQ